MTVRKLSPVFIFSILGITAIILFLIISASGFRGLLPGSHLYRNKTDKGFYVFYRLLEELEYPIVFESVYHLPAGGKNTIVYLDMNDLDEKGNEELSQWVIGGNNLILSGDAADIFFNRETYKDINRENFLYSNNTYKISRVFLKSFLKGLNKRQIISESENGAVIVKTQSGKGSILLISDMTLFNNQNLHNLVNALLLEDLLYPYSKTSILLREKVSETVFDPSLIKGIFFGKLKYITTHLILIFLLFLLLIGKRFSKPEQLTGKTRRKISEHIEATGLFYQRAGAFSLIENTDSEYFKVVICKNRKPAMLSDEVFKNYSISDPEKTEEEIIRRFKTRNALITKLRSRNNG